MWYIIIFFAVLSTPVHTAKILGVFHMTARSHYILGSSLMRALAERGHEVTVISPFGEKDPPKNGSYRDVVLTGLAEEHDKMIKELNFFEKKNLNPLLMMPMMAVMTLRLTEQTLNHTNVKKFMQMDEKFDLVIVEEFANPAHKAFANHFGAHLVVLSTLGANVWVNEFVGNPTPLAYVSDIMLHYPSRMTFWQRLVNTAVYCLKEIIQRLYILPQHQQLVNKYFPQEHCLEDLIHNISLVLLNSHPSTNQQVPLVPQMVDIGGFHIQPPKKLPKDLQTYLDNSKGVIYFSLGSNMKSILLPVEKREAFIKAFSQLNLDVLWKWEDDALPNKPPNVRIEKWLPQQDILAHPNIKLFITHAGLLSTTETIYHGVPVLAVPIGGDQNLNAKQIENDGIGLQMPFQDVTAETFLEKINQVLSDPSYRKMAKERSEFFHDREVKPMDLAIYWVEYVLKHGGTKHLRVAALDLYWYQYFLLDVVAVILIVGGVFVYVGCKMFGNLCCKKREQKRKRKVKEQ